MELWGDDWTDTRCAECWPELMPENQDAYFIYSICRDQLIVGMCGPIAINQLAVHEAIRLYEIDEARKCFEKVIQLSAKILDMEREKAKGKGKQHENSGHIR